MAEQKSRRRAHSIGSADDISPAIDFDIELHRRRLLSWGLLEADARRSGRYREFLDLFSKQCAKEGLLERPFVEHRLPAMEEQLKKGLPPRNAAPMPASAKIAPMPAATASATAVADFASLPAPAKPKSPSARPTQPSEKFRNLIDFAVTLHGKGQLSHTKLQKMAKSTKDPKTFKALFEYECRRKAVNPHALLRLSPAFAKREERWEIKKKTKGTLRG